MKKKKERDWRSEKDEAKLQKPANTREEREVANCVCEKGEEQKKREKLEKNRKRR